MSWIGIYPFVPPGLTAGGGLKPRIQRCVSHTEEVPPGLTAGGGLKPSGQNTGCEKIAVPPGLTAGGGLKRPILRWVLRRSCVPPGLTAGGGLKLVSSRDTVLVIGSPRPHRRGRIETRTVCGDCGEDRSSPRPHRRGRIETAYEVWNVYQQSVPPGLTAGGGLKHHFTDDFDHGSRFPPASPPGAD